jgi:plastocyanin
MSIRGSAAQEERSMPTVRLPALIAVAMLTIAACSGGASPSPSAAAASTAASASPSAAAASAAASASAPASAAAGAAGTVDIKNTAFNPTSLTVAAGTKVTWTNSDGFAHTVTLDDNSVDSGNIAGGVTFDHTFATAGTFAYHCKIHSTMHGTVTVTG